MAPPRPTGAPGPAWGPGRPGGDGPTAGGPRLGGPLGGPLGGLELPGVEPGVVGPELGGAAWPRDRPFGGSGG